MSNHQVSRESVRKTSVANMKKLLYASFVCFSILLLPACATNSKSQQPPEKTESDANIGSTAFLADSLSSESELSKLEQEMQTEWGIQVVGIRQSAAGFPLPGTGCRKSHAITGSPYQAGASGGQERRHIESSSAT